MSIESGHQWDCSGNDCKDISKYYNKATIFLAFGSAWGSEEREKKNQKTNSVGRLLKEKCI